MNSRRNFGKLSAILKEARDGRIGVEWKSKMATSGGQKDERLMDSSGTVFQDSSPIEDGFDSDSDDEEIVSIKLLYHAFLSEK